MTALWNPTRLTRERNEFGVDVASDNAATLVRVRGEVDLDTAPLMEQQLQQLVGEGAREIIVDLAEVTFLDAAALGALVRTANRLRRCDGDIRVSSPTGSVQRTLQITGLDAFFLAKA